MRNDWKEQEEDVRICGKEQKEELRYDWKEQK